MFGNLDNQIFAAGNNDDEEQGVEIFNIGSNKWTIQKFYPYCTRYVNRMHAVF